MFSRIPGWSLSASARLYSTTPAPKASSPGFLSDLMKRIDTINMKTDEISKKQKQQSAADSKLARVTQKIDRIDKSQSQQQIEARAKTAREQKKTGAAPVKVANRAPKQAPRVRIAVADHPLSSNMFKLMDTKNFGGQNRNTRPAGDRTAKAGDRPAGRPAGRPGRPGQGAFSRPGAKRGGSDRKFKMPVAKVSRDAGASIVPKKLQAAALRPVLGANTFLYGKPAKLGVSTTSRVAAVAKEFLLKSKYPYKLPRSIIDGLDERFAGNKFLLQRDFNTEVDAAQFEGRVRRVVRGETDDIKARKGASVAEKEAHRGLMDNGSLSLEQKQTIYDVVTGAKSASSLTEGAVWNK